MKYLQSSFTMEQYKPNPDMCCEACVFKRGEHSEWCDKAKEAQRVAERSVISVFTIRMPK